MGLQEKPVRSKKQREKCQSTLTTSGALRTPSKPVKFSDDIKKLQEIHSVRNEAVGKQMKRVIDLLFKTWEALTAEQINEACYVDMNANKPVFDSLAKNPKVHYDGMRFSYKSKHDLKDKDQLLSLIRKFPEGIAVTDLEDAYPTVMEDLQALKAGGLIWLLTTFNPIRLLDVVYPNDPKFSIKVDGELRELFHGIKLPDMLDIEKDLRKNGMKPATNTAQRRAAPLVLRISSKPKQVKKKHGISKRTKLINGHLPELFQNLGSS